MNRLRSIYFRLFIPYTATLVVALILSGWIGTRITGQALQERLGAQLSHAVDNIAAGQFPLTQDLIDRLAQLLDAELVLLTGDGTVAETSGGLTTGAATHIMQSLSASADGPGADGPLVLTVANETWIVVQSSLATGHDARFSSVAALASLADVRAATRRAARWLVLIVLLGILVSAWLGHRHASAITDPMRDLIDMADKIAAGDRSVRMSATEPAEIGNLVDSINKMAGQLEIYENKLVDRQRMAALGDLAAQIAHEIRNPLTAIKLQLELLRESLDGAERERSDKILAEIDRLELIVSRTLGVAGGKSSEPAPTRLNELAADVAGLVSPQLEHQGVSLTLDFADTPPVDLDAGRTRQVLLNLITNAARAAGTGGSVRISTWTNDTHCGVTVEDSGPGIAGNIRERLMYEPIDDTGSGHDDGLGLGLILSRKLIEQQNGSLGFDSSDALGGARFTAQFPLS